MRPIMMDNFPKMSGKSMFVKNVKELSCQNVTITGSEDEAPEMNACERVDLKGLSFSKKSMT